MQAKRAYKVAKLLATGAIMLQTAGCDFLDLLNTTLLGITAAGAVALISNI